MAENLNVEDIPLSPCGQKHGALWPQGDLSRLHTCRMGRKKQSTLAVTRQNTSYCQVCCILTVTPT
jgi:hypothetical protein